LSLAAAHSFAVLDRVLAMQAPHLSAARVVRASRYNFRMRQLVLTCFVLIAFAAVPLRAQQTTPGAQPPTRRADASANQAPPLDMVVGPVQENLVYGVANGETLLLDVFGPANNTGLPRPAILLIHGGAWNSFDKSTMWPLAHFLALAGFVAIPVDYRLFNNDINHWPAQLDDVQMAVRWVRANSAKYNIDRNHIGAYGHSAGGQLALLLGMMDTRDNSDQALAQYSSKVQAAVDAAGPTDFTTQNDKEGIEYMTSFLGADYTKHPQVWRDASPISHVAKSNAPILIIHGTKDDLVPVAEADALNEALKKAGATVQYLRLESDHGFSDAASHRRLALETQTFFFHYLASQSAP
jgi:acetyl esterase/lipase